MQLSRHGLGIRPPPIPAPPDLARLRTHIGEVFKQEFVPLDLILEVLEQQRRLLLRAGDDQHELLVLIEDGPQDVRQAHDRALGVTTRSSNGDPLTPLGADAGEHAVEILVHAGGFEPHVLGQVDLGERLRRDRGDPPAVA